MQANRLPTYVIAGAAMALVAVVAGVPLASFLSFAVILLCPLMMFFMMKNMGGMHGGSEERSARRGAADHERTGSHHS
jgi:type III secretory pathway component EscV